MASYTIEVVLRDEVPNLGRSGDVVRVKPGYARNYLLPRGLAAMASRGNVAQVEHEKRLAKARADKQLKVALDAAKELLGVRVVLHAQAGEEGKLFGSVTTRDIASALAAQGHEIDRRQLVLEEPIKAIGEYQVVAKLGMGVTEAIKVAVEAA